VNKAERTTPNKELHNKTALRVILIHFSIKKEVLLLFLLLLLLLLLLLGEMHSADNVVSRNVDVSRTKFFSLLNICYNIILVITKVLIILKNIYIYNVSLYKNNTGVFMELLLLFKLPCFACLLFACT
jgi:hypothetical protein